jgi:hypothetical protein
MKGGEDSFFSATPPLIQSDTAKKRTTGKAGTLLLQHCLQLFGFACFLRKKPPKHSLIMSSTEDDPVIASYDIVLTDSTISRYVFQYLDRPVKLPYNARRGQKPNFLRMKPDTGMVEIEVPIQTRATYDVNKGLKYGDAMKKSRANRDGGAFGMAGGFSSGTLASGGGRVKAEGSGDLEVLDNRKMVDPSSLVTTQALGGRIKPQEEGDPVYMLATFKGSKYALCWHFNDHYANSYT